MNSLLILAIYLDVSTVCDGAEKAAYIENANEYFKHQAGLTHRRTSKTEAEIITFMIPVKTETRIECVYPVFATDEKLEEMLARSVQAFKDVLEND